MRVLDSTGYDIGPLVQNTAAEYGIPVVGLLALLRAESKLNPAATRQGAWPDWSYGLGQTTVQLAASYGIGDGTPASWPVVVAALSNRATAIRLAADYYRFGLHTAEDADPSLAWDDWLLMGMIVYNSGGYQEPGNWYWQKFADNVKRYREALAWAHTIVS